MKNILTILFVFIGISTYAQGGFKINEDNQVIWQKVYENQNINFDDLVNTIKANSKFSDISVYDNKITCLLNDVDPELKGFSRMSTPFYILGKLKGYFTIDFKEGRYRITGTNLQSALPKINLAYSTPSYEYTPYEESVVKKGSFRKEFSTKYYVAIENTLEREFKVIKSTDDNW